MTAILIGALCLAIGYALGSWHERRDRASTPVRRAERFGTWREEDEPRSSGIRELFSGRARFR